MNLYQFLKILKARWIAASVVLTLTVTSALTVSLLLPKQYTANAAVVVDMKSPDPILGVMMGGILAPSYMATQVDIVVSDRVAQRVVRDLELTKNAQLRTDWLEDTQGKGSIEAWAANLIQKRLDVKPSRESNVINISYKATDPRFAATLANAFAKAYIDTSIELRVDPARQYSSFFDARAKELRATLEKAQAKLSNYQRDRGVLVGDQRLDVETQRLNDLSTQLVTLQAVSAESTSRSAQAHNSADRLQEVINNPVIANLRAEQSRQEARLQELDARLGEAHPQVQELKANIASLKQRIDTETARVGSSLGINNTINRSREADVRAALEVQRAKVAKIKEQRDEAAVLVQDVEAAQRAYDGVAQRLNQSSLESQTSQTNIAILTPATEPTEHSSPKILLNTLLSIFLGGLLSTAYALVRELMDRRVRSVTDLTDFLGVPVLGCLPKPLGGNAGKSGAPLLLPNNVLGRLPSSGR